MIELRFVTSQNSAVSAGIRAFEYGFWASHVDAVMRDGTYLGAHFDGGVLARQPGYDAADMLREQFVVLSYDEHATEVFEDFLRKQLGKPYDLTAIGSFITGRDWQEPDSWFCSELQAAALVACGWFAYPLATEVNHITPRDLMIAVSARVQL